MFTSPSTASLHPAPDPFLLAIPTLFSVSVDHAYIFFG